MPQDDEQLRPDEARLGREYEAGDDDVHPLKYYGSFALVLLAFVGLMALFFV